MGWHLSTKHDYSNILPVVPKPVGVKDLDEV